MTTIRILVFFSGTSGMSFPSEISSRPIKRAVLRVWVLREVPCRYRKQRGLIGMATLPPHVTYVGNHEKWPTKP